MNVIDKVISIAKAEVGYLEKASNASLDSKTANAGYNNYTKYWRDIKPGYQGQPWCACFVTWVLVQAFGQANAKKLLRHYPYVYVPTLAGLFTNYANPQPGDIVMFKHGGEFTHTGIVTSVSGDYFTTVEGNTSGGSSIVANGGGVCAKGYYNSNLPGTKFARLDYSLAGDASTSTTPETPIQSDGILRYGSTGAAVKTMQSMLIACGYSCGTAGIDGDFGKGTEGALVAFQRRYGLTPDGEYGPLSKAKLEAVYVAKQAGTDSVYVVQPGDTLSQIAKDHDTTVDALVQLNGIQNPNMIILGQKIKLPAAKQVGKCTGDCVNVHSGPGTSYGVLRMLNKGNLFDILGYNGDWVKVNVAGTVGYVHRDYVSKV